MRKPHLRGWRNEISCGRCEIPSQDVRGKFHAEMPAQFSVVKQGQVFT